MIISKEQALKEYEEMINNKIRESINEGKTKTMLPKDAPSKIIEELKEQGYYVQKEIHDYSHDLIGYEISWR